MIESSLYNEADKLKKELGEDPLSFYRKFLAFSKQYSDSPKVHDEAVLLGSLITELIENSSDSFNLRDSVNEIERKSSQIINTILEQNDGGEPKENNADDSKLKEHFSKRIPELRSVFIGENIKVKISRDFSLRNISLELRLGEITGLVGENGNGKTSLLKIIAAELKPDLGSTTYPLFYKKK